MPVTSDMTYFEELSKKLQSRRVASDVIEGRRKYLTDENRWWVDHWRMTDPDPERERVIPRTNSERKDNA